MGDEQRRFPRKSLQVDIRARDSGSAGLLMFEGQDLSAGGSFLKSELLLEQGEPLSVEFRVPGVARLIQAQARVAWVRRFPRPEEDAGMGIQFVTLVDEDRGVLERFLSGP